MSMELETFIVKNCSIHASPEGVQLDIVLERLSSSFWLSFFIPYMFLILAAEITLFIDEAHFKVWTTLCPGPESIKNVQILRSDGVSVFFSG